jgi:hypothetical protein
MRLGDDRAYRLLLQSAHVTRLAPAASGGAFSHYAVFDVRCLDSSLLAVKVICAEPGLSTAALEEHAQSCPVCAGLRAEMRALDERLRHALAGQPACAGRDWCCQNVR